jgi:hypothetical protein
MMICVLGFMSGEMFFEWYEQVPRGDLRERPGRLEPSSKSPRGTCSLPVKKHFATSRDYFLIPHPTRPRPQTPIDGNRTWLTKPQLEKFDQTEPLLKELLAKGNKPVIHNTVKLQKDDAATCGRYAVARILNQDMPLKEFVAEIKEGSGTPDQNVTAYTYNFLKK